MQELRQALHEAAEQREQDASLHRRELHETLQKERDAAEALLREQLGKVKQQETFPATSFHEESSSSIVASPSQRSTSQNSLHESSPLLDAVETRAKALAQDMTQAAVGAMAAQFSQLQAKFEATLQAMHQQEQASGDHHHHLLQQQQQQQQQEEEEEVVVVEQQQQEEEEEEEEEQQQQKEQQQKEQQQKQQQLQERNQHQHQHQHQQPGPSEVTSQPLEADASDRGMKESNRDGGTVRRGRGDPVVCSAPRQTEDHRPRPVMDNIWLSAATATPSPTMRNFKVPRAGSTSPQRAQRFGKKADDTANEKNNVHADAQTRHEQTTSGPIMLQLDANELASVNMAIGDTNDSNSAANVFFSNALAASFAPSTESEEQLKTEEATKAQKVAAIESEVCGFWIFERGELERLLCEHLM